MDKILEGLATDYVDLLLIHWPFALNPNGNHPLFPTKEDGKFDIDDEWDISETWKQMEAAQRSGNALTCNSSKMDFAIEKPCLPTIGRAKNIGVSNFSEYMLHKILPKATIKPAVDQVELHLYNPSHNLVAFLKSEGIVPQAYSPLGSTNAPLFQDELVQEIAKKHNVEPAQVLIGYLGTWFLSFGDTTAIGNPYG